MRSNKVGYSTPSGPCCMANNAKVPFCMLEFSCSKIISHRFHVNKNEGESGIGYEMIVGRDLMVQLVL